MSRKSGRMEPERPAAPVLVIEDNAEVRHALVALLEAEGYRVVEAGDGVSALRLLRAGEVQPCLIVLDLMMPRMSGWDFRREQSNDRRFAAIPVVVLSADPLASQAERIGAAAVLPKPADPERFLEVIGRHCTR
jgi:CheY-like chemotaxis protein